LGFVIEFVGINKFIICNICRLPSKINKFLKNV
jgi:hypothetical protein